MNTEHPEPAALSRAFSRLERLKPGRFELSYSRKTAVSIDVKDGKVDSLSRAEDVGLSIRVLKDQRMAFSFTTSLDPEAVDRAVDSAIDTAAEMPEDEYADLFDFSTAVYPELDLRDSKGLSIDIKEQIEAARRLEIACRSADKRVTAIRSAQLKETQYETRMIDTDGERIGYDGLVYTASLLCKADGEGSSEMGGDFGFSRRLDSLDVESVGRGAAERACELLGAQRAPTARCPAILRNDVAADLLHFLAHGFSAEQIDKGRSPLVGREGERVFSPAVSVVSDGLLSGGFASAPFDAEGVPCSSTKLVDGGAFAHALYDLRLARKTGAKSTGCADRSVKSPPSIGISNLYLEKGKKNLSSLIASIDNGVLITGLLGLHTANSVTGDFSLGATGLWIEKGKIARPVTGFAVAGNVLELFRRVTDAGSDLRFFGDVGAPSIRVSEISVGGT